MKKWFCFEIVLQQKWHNIAWGHYIQGVGSCNKTKVLSWNLIVYLFWDHLMWYLMWSVGIFKTRHLQLLNFLVYFGNFLLRRSVICEFWWSCILAKWKNTLQSFIHTAYALYICGLAMLNKLLILPPQRRSVPDFVSHRVFKYSSSQVPVSSLGGGIAYTTLPFPGCQKCFSVGYHDVLITKWQAAKSQTANCL